VRGGDATHGGQPFSSPPRKRPDSAPRAQTNKQTIHLSTFSWAITPEQFTIERVSEQSKINVGLIRRRTQTAIKVSQQNDKSMRRVLKEIRRFRPYVCARDGEPLESRPNQRQVPYSDGRVRTKGRSAAPQHLTSEEARTQTHTHTGERFFSARRYTRKWQEEKISMLISHQKDH
jgi:hypothetical protein